MLEFWNADAIFIAFHASRARERRACVLCRLEQTENEEFGGSDQYLSFGSLVTISSWVRDHQGEKMADCSPWMHLGQDDNSSLKQGT